MWRRRREPGRAAQVGRGQTKQGLYLLGQKVWTCSFLQALGRPKASLRAVVKAECEERGRSAESGGPWEACLVSMAGFNPSS